MPHPEIIGKDKMAVQIKRMALQKPYVGGKYIFIIYLKIIFLENIYQAGNPSFQEVSWIIRCDHFRGIGHKQITCGSIIYHKKQGKCMKISNT